MNIKRYFYNILLSIYNQKKDSFFLLIVFMLMTTIIFIFYGFSISSEIIVYSYDERFYEEGNKLVEGIKIPYGNDVLIAKNTIIEHKLLNIGDDIILTNNNGETIKLNVAGIYSNDNAINLLDDNLYQSDSYQIIMDEKTLLDFASKNDDLIIGDIMVEFKGVGNSEEVINIVNNSLSSFIVQGNAYDIEIDDELAQKLKLPIQNASRLYGLMVTVFFVTLTILLIFILVYCVKNRTKEYGIWMTMGLNKISLVLKFFIEVSILMSAAFIICLPLSKVIFRQINNSMVEQNDYTQAQIMHLYDTEVDTQVVESEEYLVEIDVSEYINIYLFLLLICLLSSLISFISLFNKKVIEFIK